MKIKSVEIKISPFRELFGIDAPKGLKTSLTFPEPLVRSAQTRIKLKNSINSNSKMIKL